MTGNNTARGRWGTRLMNEKENNNNRNEPRAGMISFDHDYGTKGRRYTTRYQHDRQKKTPTRSFARPANSLLNQLARKSAKRWCLLSRWWITGMVRLEGSRQGIYRL